MTSSVRYSAHRQQHGGARLPALLALMLVFGAGVLAYRHFFQRPGEAAINLIPSNAMMVITLDTTPSPEQAPVFHDIRDALQREHLSSRFDELVTHLLADSPIATQLRPTLANSFAGAIFKGAAGITGTPHWAFFAALKTPDATRAIIAQHGAPDSQTGLTFYTVPNATARMAVIESYLVVADQPDVFAHILAVSRGEAPSVAGLAEFQTARAALPTDSNLMCFVAPQSLQEAQGILAQHGALGQQAAGSVTRDAHWLAFGVAIHSHGIDTVLDWPVTLSSADGGDAISHIAPLDAQLLKHLPSGAYGLLALAQPGRYWTSLTASAGQNAAMRHSLDEGVSQFERETGMSVAHDVLPAFEGDVTLAIYHDAEGRANSADGLIVIDDAQNADPATLAAKVRDYVTRVSGRNGGTPVRFVSERQGNATIWSVDPDTQNRMRGAISGAVPTPPETPVAPPSVFASSAAQALPNTSAPTQPADALSTPPAPPADAAPSTAAPTTEPSATPESPTASAPATPGDNRGAGNVESVEAETVQGARPTTPVQRAMAGKSLVWAEVGRAVLIASSRRMLDRALAAFTTGTGSLADDPAYAQMSRQAQPQAQALLMVDLPGIMDTIHTSMAQMQEGRHPQVTANDLSNLFGHGSGVVGALHYDGNRVRATFSMPLDYTTVIRLLGAAGNAVNSRAATPSQGRGEIF